MAVGLPITDPRLSIGGANGLLLVGESFDQIYETLAFEGGDTCADVPITFVGFTMTADVLDSTGGVLESFTVTPSVGDTVGSYRIQLAASLVTAALRDNATRWRFRFSDGSNVTKSLLFNEFTVT